MSFTEVLIIVLITALIISSVTFFVSGLVFALGTKNREEEAYRKGFEDGKKSNV